MSEIERFDRPRAPVYGQSPGRMTPSIGGEFVRFTDHQASLAAVTADRDRMVEALKEVERAYWAEGKTEQQRCIAMRKIASAALTSTEDRT